MHQAFFTEEYSQQHPDDRDKLLRLTDLIAWQVLSMQTHTAHLFLYAALLIHSTCSLDSIAWWRNSPPWKKGDR